MKKTTTIISHALIAMVDHWLPVQYWEDSLAEVEDLEVEDQMVAEVEALAEECPEAVDPQVGGNTIHVLNYSFTTRTYKNIHF